MNAIIERPMPMPLLLAEKARLDSDRVLAVFNDVTFTYASLHSQSMTLAAALARRGIRKGDPVILLMGNEPEMLVSLFALAYIGAIAVPTNPALKGQSLAHVFNVTKAKSLLLQSRYLERVYEALNGRQEFAHVIVIEDDFVPSRPGEELYSALMAEKNPLPAVSMAPSDPWMVLFTSGTTGVSKGVMLPHQQLSSTSWDIARSLFLDEDSIFYTFYPLFHLNAIIFGPFGSLIAGGKTVIRREFPREQLRHELHHFKATHWSALPFLLRGLLAQPPRDDDRDIPLKYVTCIAMTADDIEAFERRFNCQMFSGYGATESAMVGLPAPARRCSAGKQNPRHQVRVVNAEGRDAAPGEVGEFWIKPYHVYDCMLGYYNMPEETAKAYEDGWFKTGDLGWRDEEGYLHFTDRVKESLKRRGENISTFEVETVLQTYPGITSAAVVGYKEPGAEEEVRAFLELSPDAPPLDYAALVQHCTKHLAYFMVPRYFDTGVTLPRTPLGKIEKHKLKSYPLSDTTFDVKAAGIHIER